MTRSTKVVRLSHLRRGVRRESAASTRLPADAVRPRTRAECVDGPRPCPWVSCRHHLLADVTAHGGLRLPQGHSDVELLVESCSLDVADQGGLTLDQIGELLGVSRQRADQLARESVAKLAAALGEAP